MRTKLRSKFTLFFIVCAALLAVGGTAMALVADPSGNTAPAPTIQSDQADYPPGATVTLTGSNWQPGESVHINVNDDQGQTWSRDADVTADASGNITDSFNLPNTFVATYSVKATGASGAVATSSFTDASLTLKRGPTGNPPNVTYTATYQTFTNNTCTTGGGSIQTAPPVNSDAGTPLGGLGGGSGGFVNITAPATPTSPANYTFDKWTAEGDNLTILATSNGGRTICVRNPTASQNDIYRATYKVANQAPVAQPQPLVSTNEDTAKTITLSGTDADGNNLTFAIVSGPTNGSLGSIGAVTCTGTAPKTCSANVTYTPNNNYNGGDSFTFKANDGTVDSPPAPVPITVNPVNDAPSFQKGANETVNEDSGAHSVPNWATAISAGPANESSQALNFIVSNDNNSLFTATGQPQVSANGTLSYTLAADASGTATVDVKLHDDGGTANGGVDTSAAQTFTITVNGVNDAPSFTKGANQTVNEDAGAQTVSGWTTAISAGPNESGQTVQFIVTNDNNGLFTTGGQPAVDSSGKLTYTPAADKSGSATVTIKAKDSGGTGNGGVDESASQTFTITVNAVNDPPSFQLQANPDQTVNEDSGVHNVTSFVTSFSAGPNESGQTVDFQLTNDNNNLFASGGQPAIDASGKLTYEAAPNANGNATVTVKAHDDGGTANGGQDTSASQTFTITVNSVNDAPSFTKGADETVNEDSGAHSVSGWATAISAGPNESGQQVDFQVTNDNNSLFTTGGQPQIAPNGTLSYTLADNANGNATVTVKLHDDGGTANGGVDTSASQTFTITINSVNDAPSFTKGADQTKDEDAGAQSVPGWATNISKGPADENGQTLDFIVSNSNNSLFTATGQPKVSPTGDLSYTLADNANGNATVTVKLHDDGGTANGGVDTSAAQTFTITINSVNDAPVVTFTDPTGDTQTLDEDKTTTRLYKYTVTDVDNANPTVTESCGSGGSLKPDETGDPTQNSFRCLFADDATTTVSATANDGEASNNTGSDSIAVTVNNVAPKVNLTGPTTANEGETKTYSFTITDPGADTFNFPAGYPTCGAHGTLVGTPTTGDGQFQCFFPDGDVNTTTDVAVKVADDNGGVSVADTEHVEIINVQVANVNPTITVPTTNQTANEGASASFNLGSFTDPGPDSPWAVDVDWGDSSTHGSASMTSTGSLGTMNHTYADNGTKTVTVKVTDKNGGSDTKSFQVTVNNVAPTITGITVSPLQALIGQPVSFNGTATDPSSVDTTAGFSWQWSKDGGTYAAGSNPFSTSFSTCGAHNVSAKATDKDGGTSAAFTASTSVQVYSGNWWPPLQVGKDNLVQKGQVVPVKISVAGCDGINQAGLNPEIRLAKGDPTAGINEADVVVPTSVSAADTTGFMRPVSDGYIYNLRIPSDTTVKANDLYTIRVSPFGIASGQHMVIGVQIRK